MRRSILALATAVTLTFSALPAAHASSAAEELPAEATIGSSAAENLSSGTNSDEQTRDNLLDLGTDWLLGAVLVTVLGGLINLVLDAR